MKSIVLVFPLLLGACITGEPAPMADPPASFPRLIEWVSARTGYPMSPPPLWYVATDGHTRSMAGLAPWGSDSVMYYRCDRRMIVIPQTPAQNLSDEIVEAGVVHELVHHGQCLARRNMKTCEREREAYRLAAAYLRERARRPLSGKAIGAIAFFDRQAAPVCPWWS